MSVIYIFCVYIYIFTHVCMYVMSVVYIFGSLYIHTKQAVRSVVDVAQQAS